MCEALSQALCMYSIITTVTLGTPTNTHLSDEGTEAKLYSRGANKKGT